MFNPPDPQLESIDGDTYQLAATLVGIGVNLFVFNFLHRGWDLKNVTPPPMYGLFCTNSNRNRPRKFWVTQGIDR
jgi:hypothetical protein